MKGHNWLIFEWNNFIKLSGWRLNGVLPPSCLFIDFFCWNKKLLPCRGSLENFLPLFACRVNLHVVTSESNIFNNKTNTWFCPAAWKEKAKLCSSKIKVNTNLVKHQRLMISVSKVFPHRRESSLNSSWIYRVFVELFSIVEIFLYTYVVWRCCLCDEEQLSSIKSELIYKP